jgi:hypothetical protein
MGDFEKTKVLNIIYVVLKRAEYHNYGIRLQDLMNILYYAQLTHIKTYGHIIEEIAEHHAIDSGPITDSIHSAFLAKEYEGSFPIGKNQKFIYISSQRYRDISDSTLSDFVPNLDYLSKSELNCLSIETDWYAKSPIGVKQKRRDESKAYTKALAKAHLHKRRKWGIEWIDMVRSAEVPSCSVDWVLENIENCYIDLSEWELI